MGKKFCRTYYSLLLSVFFINKLFDIDLDRYDNDNKFIKERCFEVILTSFSSSNDYRPLLIIIK